MSEQIFYLDQVRFRTTTGKYVSCPGPMQHFTYIDNPDDTCVFTLQEYNYNTSYGFCYSGNLDANTIDCRMNFRLTRVGMAENTQVVSVDIDKNRNIGPNALFNGVSWGESQDFETFLAFNPNNHGSEDPIHDGDPIIIRNMRGSASNNLHKFWRDWGQRFAELGLRDPQKAAEYERYVDAAIKETNAERMFLIAANLQDYGNIVGAFGPDIDHSTVFIIELVSSLKSRLIDSGEMSRILQAMKNNH